MSVSALIRTVDGSLEAALANLGRTSGDLDLPDIIDYADVAATWSTRKERLAEQLVAQEVYAPHVEVVDLPKDRINVRPLARLDLDQRLLYEASVFSAASRIQNSIPLSVYSYRWWEKHARVMAPVRSWVRMQRRAHRYALENPKISLARTDVTSFYENVEIPTLLHQLETVHVDAHTIENLRRFLTSFNELSNVWGLPQGSTASGILSNVYLLPVDHLLSYYGFFHVRYSDDTYVFGPNWTTVRDGVVEMSRTLRGRRLSLSSSKTKIVEDEDVRAELEDSAKDSVDFGLRRKFPGSQGALRRYFDRAVDDGEPSSRDIRYSLNRFAATRDPYAFTWAIRNMLHFPEAAKEIAGYLAAIAETQPARARKVANLLTAGELRGYSYVEQHLFVHIIRLGYSAGELKDFAWHRLVDRNVDGYVREMAARFLGRCAVVGEASRLKQTFQHEPSPQVRRALLIGSFESRQATDHWLSAIATSGPALAGTAKYLQTNPSSIPLPHANKPRPM